MKIDLSKSGYQSFLKDWQVPLFIHVLTADKPTTSSEAHAWLLEHENEDFHKSRTSVIFFLQELSDEGILTKEEGTGKGGAHEVFQKVTDLNGTLTKLNEQSEFLFRALRMGV